MLLPIAHVTPIELSTGALLLLSGALIGALAAGLALRRSRRS